MTAIGHNSDKEALAEQTFLKGEAEGNAFANADLSSALEQDEPFPDEDGEAAE